MMFSGSVGTEGQFGANQWEGPSSGCIFLPTHWYLGLIAGHFAVLGHAENLEASKALGGKPAL